MTRYIEEGEEEHGQETGATTLRVIGPGADREEGQLEKEMEPDTGRLTGRPPRNIRCERDPRWYRWR